MPDMWIVYKKISANRKRYSNKKKQLNPNENKVIKFFQKLK